MATYGLPQPLTGSETITVHQIQSGQPALCTLPLSQFISFLFGSASESWIAALPTTAPTSSGILWNNNGVLSIS